MYMCEIILSPPCNRFCHFIFYHAIHNEQEFHYKGIDEHLYLLLYLVPNQLTISNVILFLSYLVNVHQTDKLYETDSAIRRSYITSTYKISNFIN